MRNLKYFIYIIISLCVSTSSQAQINRGGKPVQNSGDFDPAKVIYLLEPLEKEIVTGQKSMVMNTLKKSLDFAIERPIDLSPEYNGEWVMKDGVYVWRIHLISPGAYSLGLLFSEFELLPDVELFVYDPDAENIKGAFTSESNRDLFEFYIGHIAGQELIVELQTKREDRSYGNLRLNSLSHAFLPIFNKKQADEEPGPDASQDCEIDINCEEGDNWQIMKKSVVHLDSFGRLCTGVLINNTSYNGKPYILTAEHCINNAFRAGICVFYFGYENSGCGTKDWDLSKTMSGSRLLATTDSIDFSVIELLEQPPREFEAYYAGWDIRDQNHTGVTIIHHPYGDAKKISFESAATSIATILTDDLVDYIPQSEFKIKQWDFGTTEGGSSGGPLFNSGKKVVGLLTGGDAYCGDSIGYNPLKDRVIYSLDNNINDYFSRLSFAWDYYSEAGRQLKHWLDPIDSGQEFIGGFNSSMLDVERKELKTTQVEAYPNPAKDEVFIRLPEYTGEELDLLVIDITGKVVISEKTRSVFPVSVQLPELAGGLYFIQLKGKESISSARIIIQ